MMRKKGELTTQQLVTIIILIISFAVILILLWRLGLGEETNKEICHNSAVMKAKTKVGSFDCRTNYVCISGGGQCEEITPTYTIDINLNDEDANEKIVEAIQKEIDDCDWMFGEGELDYGGFWNFEGYHCAICNIIKFDKEIYEDDEYSIIDFNGEEISTNEKYSVFVAINPGSGKDEYIPARIIKSEDIGDKDKSRCDIFDISKA